MPCTAAWDALVSVSMTAKVSMSTAAGIGASVGDTMSLNFMADPVWIEREIVGQGVVYDGIGPFGICEEHFDLSFSSGFHAYLKPPPPIDPALAALGKDTPTDAALGLPLSPSPPPFWFSLMQTRPVADGAFISHVADKAPPGVPLIVYGAPPAGDRIGYSGVFDVSFERGTVPSILLNKAFGTYTKKSVRAEHTTIKLTRDWAANIIVEAEFESLTIAPGGHHKMLIAAAAAMREAGKKSLEAAKTAAAAAKAATALSAEATSSTCCWCDDATPADVTTVTGSDGASYKLIFSDEFNSKDRTFENGADSKWTALAVGDTANQGVAFYLPKQVTVAVDKEATGEAPEGVSAMLILTENVSHTGDSPTGEKGIFMPHISGMVQTWNKFCFTGGIVEYRARQPRGAGYWPALWMFGNLGRAVYQNSNTGLWPWSYDECDDDLELPPTDPPQRISACDDHDYEATGLHGFQGRGATELDVLEGAVTNKGTASYSVGSLQLSPGLPQHFKPPLFGFPTADGPGTWYTGLSFGTGGSPYLDGVANNGWYGPPWGSSCPTGCPDALSGGLVGLDDLDTRYWKYGMEWKVGADGYLKWYYDDNFVWGMDAASFGAYETCDTKLGVTECHRTPPRMIPNEPMSLVMNTAIGTWNGGKSALDGKHWPAKFWVDHVRVWQSVENVGCDPPDFPTKKYIEKNAWMFGEPVSPIGYDTCPESYPQSAYDNADKIKKRAAAARNTAAFATTQALFTTGGAAAPPADSRTGGVMTFVVAIFGFALTLAGGYQWGARAKHAVPTTEPEAEYAAFSETTRRA